MFLTSAKAPMENLGVEGLAWFGVFFALLVAQQDFCFQPEGGARSVWNFGSLFGFLLKQNKTKNQGDSCFAFWGQEKGVLVFCEGGMDF